jgi:hypothetical protein
MKMSETEKVLELLRAGYPNTFAFMTKDELKKVALLYFDLFHQYDVNAILSALKQYMLEIEKNPTPAGLKRNLDVVMRNQRMNKGLAPQLPDHEPDYLSEEERQMKIEELRQKLRDML